MSAAPDAQQRAQVRIRLLRGRLSSQAPRAAFGDTHPSRGSLACLPCAQDPGTGVRTRVPGNVMIPHPGKDSL